MHPPGVSANDQPPEEAEQNPPAHRRQTQTDWSQSLEDGDHRTGATGKRDGLL